MTGSSALRALASGLLAANAVPHAYAAAAGATQLTPLAGRRSGPATNALWSALNVAGSLALARGLDPGSADDRRAFKVAAAAFTTWVLASEWLTDLNG